MSGTPNAEYERLRQEHDAAIANGLVLQARRIFRRLAAIERDCPGLGVPLRLHANGTVRASRTTVLGPQ